jgi:hypothetical protein
MLQKMVPCEQTEQMLHEGNSKVRLLRYTLGGTAFGESGSALWEQTKGQTTR